MVSWRRSFSTKYLIFCAGLCLVSYLGAAGFFSPAEGVVVRPVNLSYMAEHAGIIFSGVCTGSELTYDRTLGREVYLYSFDVQKMIKGVSRRHITVKTSKTLVDLRQVPVYEPGDEVVLFLTRKSTIGFQSPIGLGQGKFSVITGADGRKAVVNAWGNRNLFNGMESIARTGMFRQSPARLSLERALNKQKGPVGYGHFLNLVELLLDR